MENDDDIESNDQGKNVVVQIFSHVEKISIIEQMDWWSLYFHNQQKILFYFFNFT